MVAGEVLQAPLLLGGEVDLPVGAPDAPVGVRDACGIGNGAEVLADGLRGELADMIAKMCGEGGRDPLRGGRVVVGEREAAEGLKVGVLG